MLLTLYEPSFSINAEKTSLVKESVLTPDFFVGVCFPLRTTTRQRKAYLERKAKEAGKKQDIIRRRTH